MFEVNANVVISMPSQLFTLANSFEAAANGKIYVGKTDTDPTISANQIQVYLQNDGGSTVPVVQPITINAGGYPVYNGQVAKFVTVEGHSMAVYNSSNVQQFYFPNVLKYDPDMLRTELNGEDGFRLIGQVPSVAELRLRTPSIPGQQYLLRTYYAGGSAVSGGTCYYDATDTTSLDDGITTFVTATGQRIKRQIAGAILLEFAGVVGDGVTDNTSAMAAAINTYTRAHGSESVTFVTSKNHVYNPEVLTRNISKWAIIQSDGSITAINSPGYRQRLVGIVSRDAAEDDTSMLIGSGHHPALVYNNYRTSDSESANLCRITTGILQSGITKSGQGRNILQPVFRIEPNGTWIQTLRRLSTAQGVIDKNNQYEFWGAGMSAVIGNYFIYRGRMYVAASSGVTGNIPPTHTSGTVSDGGVNLTFVVGSDSEIYTIDENGRTGHNAKPANNIYRYDAMTRSDPSTKMGYRSQSIGVSVPVEWALYPTNSTGTPVRTVAMYADGDLGSTGFKSPADNWLFRITDNYCYSHRGIVKVGNNSSESTTPNISGVNTLYLLHSTKVVITDFINGEPEQELQIIATNGNVTVKNNGNIKLSGGADVTLTAFSILTLRRVRAALTSAWIEVSRSIK